MRLIRFAGVCVDISECVCMCVVQILRFFWVTLVQRGVRVCDVSDSRKPISHIRRMDYVWLIWYINEVIKIYLDIYFFYVAAHHHFAKIVQDNFRIFLALGFASCCAHHQKPRPSMDFLHARVRARDRVI